MHSHTYSSAERAGLLKTHGQQPSWAPDKGTTPQQQQLHICTCPACLPACHWWCLAPSSGRSLTLLDPTYASRFVPIIASVSEHQPTSWPSYLTDLHFGVLLAPAGLIAGFRKLGNGGCGCTVPLWLNCFLIRLCVSLWQCV
jgi:hypothetical protein